MQYLVVQFDEDRGVIVNKAPGAWRTNRILQLQAGNYIITLAPPLAFTPPEIWLELKNTTVLQPKTITFAKVQP